MSRITGDLPMHSRNAPALIDCLTGSGQILPVFSLIDVGVSAGIYPIWRKWGDKLRAVGFDPSTHEIEALREEETNPYVTYECTKVTGPRPASGIASPPQTTYPLHRTSAYAAAEILENCSQGRWWKNPKRGPTDAAFTDCPDPNQDPFYRHHARRMNRGQHPLLTSRQLTLDDYFGPEARAANFLKIDTDGYELDVLRGGEALFDRCWFDFVEVECQFHGPRSHAANIFSHIDTFLRDKGFSLYKMDPHTYSRRALPYPFQYEIAAQTKGGPLQWADALYVRDPLSQPTDRTEWTPERLLQMALVFDLYGLSDCSAEVLVEFQSQLPLPEKLWWESMDFLTRKVRPGFDSFRSFTSAFARDPLNAPPGYRSRRT